MHTTSFLPNSLLTCRSCFFPILPKAPHIGFIPIRSFSDQDKDQDKNHQSFPLRLLQFSTTLTIVSTSLSISSVVPVALSASNISEKKRTLSRKRETLSPQELKSWCRDLPTINERIPYTDVLRLKEDGKLKYIVKLQSSDLKYRPDPVLVVLDDSRVFRTTFPSVNRDERFWSEWERLELNSVCINAYTPPVKPPQLPMPLLGFLIKWMPSWMISLVNDIPNSLLKRSMEERSLKRGIIDEKKGVDSAIQAENKLKDKLKRMEMRRLRKVEYQQSIEETKMKYRKMDLFWKKIANDSFIINTIGIIFFYLFYRVVVLNYRKQKKDYEDRLKIEESEREEKKKIKILEREMAGLGPGDGMDEVEDGEGGTEENPYLKMAANFMQSGARVRRARGKKQDQFMDSFDDVKFTDIAGLGKIRVELEEVVKFFTHGDMYRRRGVKIPGGILLCGPPGVGKTLLAKAVAGEAGVNFFSISASQFVEIYVGVGASRVRALYQEAKDNAPSVVFIDELDAVGRERGLIQGSGGQERDATLNQLLVSLDGFEGSGDVITIAATNRPDILDPALVRPGRFDRKIYIPKPGVLGRHEILQVHARKKSLAKDIDFTAVASMTDGMVGAELANIIEVAAINMMRDGRSEVNTDDLLQAAQFEERGHLDKKERSLDMWKQLALNEAAMAVLAVNFPDMNNIEFITISPRSGQELGYVRVKMDSMKFDEGMLSRQSLLDHITVQLAPRAADEIWYGEDKPSTISAETTDNARSAARSFVLGGFSENYHGISKFWVTDRLNDIDLEALRILNICYNRSKEILIRNRILVDVLVDKLVNKKSLAKQEFFQLVEEYGHLESLPPSIVDIRRNRQAELQEIKG